MNQSGTRRRVGLAAFRVQPFFPIDLNLTQVGIWARGNFIFIFLSGLLANLTFPLDVNFKFRANFDFVRGSLQNWRKRVLLLINRAVFTVSAMCRSLGNASGTGI